MGLHPGWWFDKLTTDPLQFAVFTETGGTVADLINRVFDPTVTIADFGWLRDAWKGPLVIKGIQTVDDARAVVDAGADAIVISNHGGRQLDRAPTPLEQLPAIAAAVGDRAEVFVDGGIMSGADVIAAVAMGARAALVGRAYLYGLMAGGERGVARAGELLRKEAVRTMQLLGVRERRRARPGARPPPLDAVTDRRPDLADRRRARSPAVRGMLRRCPSPLPPGAAMPDPTDPSRHRRRPAARCGPDQVREHTPEPLTDDELFAITEVARWSGSSSNDQPWRFIVDPRRGDARSARGARACRRPGRSRRPPRPSSWSLPAAKDRAISNAFDDGRATERMLVAATMLGIGGAIAWLRPDIRDEARVDPRRPRRLDGPDHGARSGIPTAAAARPKTTHGEARRPRDETVFEERWPLVRWP